MQEEPGLLHKRHAQAECPDTAFLVRHRDCPLHLYSKKALVFEVSAHFFLQGQQRPWLGPESPENGQEDGSASGGAVTVEALIC